MGVSRGHAQRLALGVAGGLPSRPERSIIMGERVPIFKGSTRNPVMAIMAEGGVAWGSGTVEAAEVLHEWRCINSKRAPAIRCGGALAA